MFNSFIEFLLASSCDEDFGAICFESPCNDQTQSSASYE